MYLGSWKIDDNLTFPANTHDPTNNGAATDADSVPTYRVYEDETGTAILTGSMAKLDDANTTGFYTEQIALSAANGLEKGKCYTIYIEATINSVKATLSHTFQIEAEVDANVVSDKTGYSISGTKNTLDDLNDVSEAQVNAQADQALVDYDAPTKAEMDSAHATTDGLITALNDFDPATENVTVNDLTAAAIDEILDEVCETEGNLTMRQILKYLMAFALGEDTISGGVVTFKTPNGNATRAAVTMDASNQRTNVSLS